MDVVHAGPRQMRQLLDAVIAIGEDLDLPVLLQRIVDAGRDLVGAKYAALGVLDASRTNLAQFITAGMTEADRDAIGELPKGHGILGMLITRPRPLRLPDMSEHPDRFGFPPDHPPMTSFLGVPLFVQGEVFGNLYFTEKLDGEVFTDVDEELATGLAAAAAGAIANARFHERTQELSRVEDRERLARALHDSVIRRLLSIGLGVQATVPLCDDGQVRSRLVDHVEQIDDVIREVRSAIFSMDRRRDPSFGVRQQFLTTVADRAGKLGLHPVVLLDGPIDATVPPSVCAELLAVVDEAIDDGVGHAGTPLRVELCVTPDARSLDLVIGDGAGGPGAPFRWSSPLPADGAAR